MQSNHTRHLGLFNLILGDITQISIQALTIHMPMTIRKPKSPIEGQKEGTKVVPSFQTKDEAKEVLTRRKHGSCNLYLKEPAQLKKKPVRLNS